MDNYKSNSHRHKEEVRKEVAEKRAQKVVSAPATIKKKNELQKMTDSFIHEDWSKIKEYAIQDVILPGIKDAIWSIFTNSLDMFLYNGSGRGRRNTVPGSRVTMTNYNAISTGRNTIHDTRPSDMRRVVDYGSVEVETRGDAEAIIMQLDEIIDAYGVVRVADLYDAAGITRIDSQTQKYGWNDISSAKPERLYNGRYTIKMPRPLPIEDK